MKPPKSFKSPRPFRALRQNESRFIRRDSNTTKGDVSGLTLHIRHSDRMTRTLCAFFPLVIGFEQKKFLSKRKSSAFKPFLLFFIFQQKYQFRDSVLTLIGVKTFSQLEINAGFFRKNHEYTPRKVPQRLIFSRLARVIPLWVPLDRPIQWFVEEAANSSRAAVSCRERR